MYSGRPNGSNGPRELPLTPWEWANGRIPGSPFLAPAGTPFLGPEEEWKGADKSTPTPSQGLACRSRRGSGGLYQEQTRTAFHSVTSNYIFI
jgi:hypothetical protein